MGEKESAAQAIFSPDSQMLAARSSNGIKAWRVSDWSPILTFNSKDIEDIAFLPDGSLAYSQKLNVRILQVSDGKIINQMDRTKLKSSNTFGDIASSPSGQMLAGLSWEVLIWDPKTGKTYNTPFPGSVCVKFSPDGQTLLTVSNGLVLLDPASGRIIWKQESNAGYSHENAREKYAFSPVSPFLASSEIYGNTIELRDLYSGRVIDTLRGHKLWVRALIFSPDGKYLISSSWDGTIRFWGVP
jgi:WD40 repeat protein